MVNYIYSNQLSLFGKPKIVGFGDDYFMVKEISKILSKKVMIEKHYSHKVCNDATTHIHLGCFIDGEMRSVLQLGYSMNPQSMSKICQDTLISEYKELNRMWFDDVAPRNTESKAISYTMKYLRGKYRKIKWVQSFADERCGRFGVVYQAANFKFYGSHISTFWSIDNEIYHDSSVTNGKRNKKAQLEAINWKERAIRFDLKQFRYIYFIDKRWIKKCLLNELPYPKHGQLNGDICQNSPASPSKTFAGP